MCVCVLLCVCAQVSVSVCERVRVVWRVHCLLRPSSLHSHDCVALCGGLGCALCALLHQRFHDLVKHHAVTMLQSAGRYPTDLMPPRVVQETLAKLVRTCLVHAWLAPPPPLPERN